MNPIVETIWKRCRRTALGRFVAGFLIGGVFGVSASLSVSHDAVTVTIGSIVAALIGGIASLFLESRDRRRSATPEWQQRVERTTAEIRDVYPHVPPLLVREAATVHEQRRFTPLVWVGLAVGLFSALCGVLAFILKIVELFRP
jgi:hypothetical protein